MIALVGPGRVAAVLARALVPAGHDVVLAADRRGARTQALAAELGLAVGGLAEVTTRADLVVVDVPWPLLEDVAEGVGDLEGAVVVDTCPAPPPAVSGLPATPAQVAAAWFEPAAYAKAFSTSTAGGWAAALRQPAQQRPAVLHVAQPAARGAVQTLLDATGLVGVELGGPERSELLEAPERSGAVHGRQYAPADAREIAAAWAAGYRDVAARLADDRAR